MQLDFSRDVHYLWALLPEVVLCIWGMVVLVVGVSGKRDERSRGLEAVTAEPSQDLGWLAFVGVLLATLLSFAVARTITRPLAAITAVMRDVASTGDLTRKIAFRSRRWQAFSCPNVPPRDSRQNSR